MTIKMILAVDQGGAIGWSDGRLAHPSLKLDMQRFKQLTTGHTVVMGRTTYLSLNRPDGLPNRHNVVLTRQAYSTVRGQFGSVDIISDLDYINLHFGQRAHAQGRDGVAWIIGGKSVYEEALRLDMVDTIYLTLVHAVSGADVVMDTDLVAWKRFVLTERKRGVNWEAALVSRQYDGTIETSYITFNRT